MYDVWVHGGNASIFGFVITIVVLSLIVVMMMIAFLLSKYMKSSFIAETELGTLKTKYQHLEEFAEKAAHPTNSSVIANQTDNQFNNSLHIEVN